MKITAIEATTHRVSVKAPLLEEPLTPAFVFVRVETDAGRDPLDPGVIPTLWDFSVRDKRVLDELNAALGKRVVLHYSEHVGVPSCFGDTSYFVNRVRVTEEGLLPLPGR